MMQAFQRWSGTVLISLHSIPHKSMCFVTAVDSHSRLMALTRPSRIDSANPNS
jgi:hypothetical protein